MHLTECFSVLRLTLSGFCLHVIFTRSCSGLFSSTSHWMGTFFFPVPELRHEKSTISPAQALGTTGKADEDRCEVLTFHQHCAEPYKIVTQACVHVQAAAVSFRIVKH